MTKFLKLCILMSPWSSEGSTETLLIINKVKNHTNMPISISTFDIAKKYSDALPSLTLSGSEMMTMTDSQCHGCELLSLSLMLL